MIFDQFIILAAFLAVVTATFAVHKFRHEFIVTDGFAGLLFHKGKLIATLPAGRHIRWGENFRMSLIDIRKTLLQVAGQEVLTADNVTVKVSIVLTTQIVDVAKSVQLRTTTLRTFTARRRALSARSSQASPWMPCSRNVSPLERRSPNSSHHRPRASVCNCIPPKFAT